MQDPVLPVQLFVWRSLSFQTNEELWKAITSPARATAGLPGAMLSAARALFNVLSPLQRQLNFFPCVKAKAL